MRQFLHLMIVDAAHRAALVTRFGNRWMLPILSVSERARSGPLVSGWLSSRGLGSEVLGQWLGRASPTQSALDWLVVVRVAEDARPISSELHWITLDHLDASTSLIEYQRWATQQALLAGDMPSVRGPFGDPSWLDHVALWIATAIGPRAVPLSRHMVWHRCGSHEVVLEGRAENRRWFFKGLARDRAAEAMVTQAMSRLMPDSFARTIALESRRDGSVWWLMEACPGISLAERFSAEGAEGVARAYANVQQRISAERADDQRPSMPELEAGSLPGWARGMFEGAAEAATGEAVASAIGIACTDVSGVDVPVSWVAPDLDPANVLLDGDEVRFIDLDDATAGPAPLGMATFARRCASALRNEPGHIDATAHLLTAYGQAWAPCLSLTPGEWRAMSLVSQVFESLLAWRRVEAKTRRGEIHGCLDSARAAIQRSLIRAAEAFGRTDQLI